MGLISHGIAVGIGYYLAQPDGQRRLTQLRQRAAAAVAQNPQATRLHERGGDLVGDRVRATRTALTARHAKTDLTTSGVTTADVVTGDLAGGNPGVDPSAPARGRRLRRQLNQKNRRRRTELPSDPPGHQAR
jgi:hypothetical protein